MLNFLSTKFLKTNSRDEISESPESGEGDFVHCAASSEESGLRASSPKSVVESCPESAQSENVLVELEEKLAKLHEKKVQAQRERDQLLRIIRQLDELKKEAVTEKPAAGESASTPAESAAPTTTLETQNEQESIRELLRHATTVEELKVASDKAGELGMSFEVNLAQKKLSKLKGA